MLDEVAAKININLLSCVLDIPSSCCLLYKDSDDPGQTTPSSFHYRYQNQLRENTLTVAVPEH